MLNHLRKNVWKVTRNLIVIAGIAVLFWLTLRQASRQRLTNSSNVNFPSKTSNVVASKADSMSSGPRELLGILNSSATNLSRTKLRDSSANQLWELRNTLATISTNEASDAIRRFLDSRIDVETGQRFKIGPKHYLESAPTLRVFLLDYLEQIDPQSAAAYARTILDKKESPDEWAVALRSIALEDSSSDAKQLLEQKLNELFAYMPWQNTPSDGYLEAFDLAVYLSGTNLVSTLADLLRGPGNRAVSFAAYLALDRMIINNKTEMLSILEASPELLESRELTRADYFARADIRDDAQRQILEAYLLNPMLSQAELNKFAAAFPSANFMISHNLMTEVTTPDDAEIASWEAEAFRLAGDWLGDARFSRLKPQLITIRNQLPSRNPQLSKSQ